MKELIKDIYLIRNRECRWQYYDFASCIFELYEEFSSIYSTNGFIDLEDALMEIEDNLDIDLDLLTGEEQDEIFQQNLKDHREEINELIQSLYYGDYDDYEDFNFLLMQLGEYAGLEVDPDENEKYYDHMLDKIQSLYGVYFGQEETWEAYGVVLNDQDE